MFLEDLGLAESGLDKLIKASYSLLGLISYLTAGEQETRAWTIKKGTKAPPAYSRTFWTKGLAAASSARSSSATLAAKMTGFQVRRFKDCTNESSSSSSKRCRRSGFPAQTLDRSVPFPQDDPRRH